MLSRRDFLKTTSLIAATPLVPQFICRTAQAAETEKDNILIVLEMTGGNDGLSMVCPYENADYHRLRPTLGRKATEVIKINDEIGIHNSLAQIGQMNQQKKLTVIQGVGYPNPDRSHFESMDRWHCGEVTQKVSGNGWLAKSVPDLAKGKGGNIPVMHIGSEKMPMAVRGTSQGVFSLNTEQNLELKLGLKGTQEEKTRQKLLEDVSSLSSLSDESALAFVQKRHLQTYTSVDKLKSIVSDMKKDDRNLGGAYGPASLFYKLDFIGRMIEAGIGARVFYVSIDGFDTHSGQAQPYANLMSQIDQAVGALFNRLSRNGDDKRTLFMTFSEFGRRVAENGSKGTDHGSASCMFVIGPGVKQNVVGKHPSFNDLDDGDLKHHTDFRQVYATILDRWLSVDSKTVLGQEFKPLDFLAKKST